MARAAVDSRRMDHALWPIGVALLITVSARGVDDPLPLPHAHAHNDYEHPHPLYDALDHGFCSVEADVFLVDGQLLVGHTPFDLKPSQTLERLYLQPLWRRVQTNEGRVLDTDRPFTLLIDIKRDGEEVYPVLKAQLSKYRTMLCGFEQGEWITRPVQVVLSGDRPRRLVALDPDRLVGIDGRLSDLNSMSPPHLLPLISDRWPTHFRWRGDGPFPEDERRRLQQIVAQAHRGGRRVRFWATPETPAVWDALLEAGVDHINTDRLTSFRDFMQAHSNQSPQ